MVGARKRPVSPAAKKTLDFDGMEHSNGQNNSKTKKAKIGKPTKSAKSPSSPRKLKKNRNVNPKKSTEKNNNVVRVAFQEEDKVVELEVQGGEQDLFPMEDEVRHTNNNATVEREGSKKISQVQVSRADRFRNKVAVASSMFNADQDGREDGEMHSSEDDSDSDSSSSLVKIKARTAEELEKEEAEYAQERDKLIQQAVDTTMEKLTTFMKQWGNIF